MLSIKEMNNNIKKIEILRQFLPSLARGVYRLDQEIAQFLKNNKAAEFIENKKKFLPAEYRKFISDRITGNAGVLLNQALSLNPAIGKYRHFFNQHEYFANWKNCKGADNYLEVEFVKKILAPLFTQEGLEHFIPQYPIGRFKADFAVVGSKKYVIETDGFGKFDYPDALDKFLARQNFLIQEGWLVFRYSYPDVMKNTKRTAKDISNIFSRDSQLKDFLEKKIHQNILQLSQLPPDIIETVNLFYAIQDYFVLELMAGDAGETVHIQDALPFKFSIVSLAISSLYSYLQGIREIFDINFRLPDVRIVSAFSHQEIHPKVAFEDDCLERFFVFDDKNDLLIFAKMMYRSLIKVGNISFRYRHESINQKIHDDLDYFSKSIFGYDKGTRPQQDAVFRNILNVQNVLALLPTGIGKSFCFWLPALLKPGLTIVISPLRSLMRDQDISLKSGFGIYSVAFINSDVKKPERKAVYTDIKLGKIRLLYIAPERMKIKDFQDELRYILESVPVNFLVIDEAHCISEWGHDFRPSYLRISDFTSYLKEYNPSLTLIALTATAGNIVKQDIMNILCIRKDEIVSAPDFDRKNLSYQVLMVKGYKEKAAAYKKVLLENIPTALQDQDIHLTFRNGDAHGIGLVFCIYADPHGKYSIYDGIAHYLYETQNLIEGKDDFSDDAFSNGSIRGFSSKTPTLCPECKRPYYMGSRGSRAARDSEDDENYEDYIQKGQKDCICGHYFIKPLKPKHWEKTLESNQKDFKDGKLDILVATKGFGMGIDKGNVRFVIHTSMAGGIESWYQEAGRAGRDEKQAHCVQIVDMPNEACENYMRSKGGKPECSTLSGCNFGKTALCDYGKQHAFISRSYPSVEANTMQVLRVLDKLIGEFDAGNNSIRITTSKMNQKNVELALYRLSIIGVIGNFFIEYKWNSVTFEVIGFAKSIDERESLYRLLTYLRNNDISENKKYANLTIGELSRKNITECKGKYASEVKKRIRADARKDKIKNYHPPDDLFNQNSENTILFDKIADYMLVVLHHVYSEVKAMRYTMLKNLKNFINTSQCRRPVLLENFQTLRTGYKEWECDFCDVCVPNLKFGNLKPGRTARNPPPDTQDRREQEDLFEEWLGDDNILFDFETANRFIKEFSDYPDGVYRRAASILQYSPRSIKALYLARECSPENEKINTTLDLIKVANRDMDLADVMDFYETSSKNISIRRRQFDILDDEYGNFDCPEGEEWLYHEAGKLSVNSTRRYVLGSRLVMNALEQTDLSAHNLKLKQLTKEIQNASDV